MRITCPECRTIQHALAGRHSCKQCRTDLRVRPNLRRESDGSVKARRAVVTVARHYGEPFKHATARQPMPESQTRLSQTDLDHNGQPYAEAECMACGEWNRIDHLQRGKVPAGQTRITVDGRPKGCRSRIGDPEAYQFKARIPRWTVLDRVCGLCRMASEAYAAERSQESDADRDSARRERDERKARGLAVSRALGLPVPAGL